MRNANKNVMAYPVFVSGRLEPEFMER